MTCDGPTVTVERAAAILHCSRRRVFQLLAERRLERAPKFGKVTTVVTASVYALLEAPPPAPAPKRKRAPRGRAQTVAELRAAFRSGAGSSA